MSADYLNRLRTDERAEDARTRMEKRGVSAAAWKRIITQLATAPGWYDVLKHETRGEQQKRREKLTWQITKLAESLRADPDAQQLRVFDHRSIITGNVKDRPTVADYLGDIADIITHKTSITTNQLFDRRQSLKSYALKVAFYLLSDAQQMRYRSPNAETALLTSALLDTKVTANDVTQLRKTERRKYDFE